MMAWRVPGPQEDLNWEPVKERGLVLWKQWRKEPERFEILTVFNAASISETCGVAVQGKSREVESCMTSKFPEVQQ